MEGAELELELNLSVGFKEQALASIHYELQGDVDHIQ